jgi:hypothetical protein
MQSVVEAQPPGLLRHPSSEAPAPWTTCFWSLVLLSAIARLAKCYLGGLEGTGSPSAIWNTLHRSSNLRSSVHKVLACRMQLSIVLVLLEKWHSILAFVDGYQ